MKIATFLERNDVTVAVPLGGKKEVLSALVERGSLLQILLKREELRSTAIEQGVAFPHGRVPGLERLLACFGRCRKGLDFDSFDGEPTYFFFVLLIPEQAQGDHLKALARLNRLFQDKAFRQSLMDAQDADAIFAAIMAEDKRS